MTFECGLQGEFDRIYAIVEDKILSTDQYIQKLSESVVNEPDYRSVVGVYSKKSIYGSVNINLILIQTGSGITISVTTSVDLGNDFNENDFNENDFINTIKSTVSNYASRSIKEDVSESGDETEPLIILTSREYVMYKNELLKSTYNHAGENTEGRNDKWEPGIIRKIKGLLKEHGIKVNDRYNYLVGAFGLFPMIMGGYILFSSFSNIINKDHVFFGFWLSVVIRALPLFLFGLVLVLGPTQNLICRKSWNKQTYKFRGWHYDGANSTNYRVIRSECYNQMLLYEKSMKIYLQDKLISLGYENVECIFETENWFVVMIDDSDIFSFAKCDMSAQEEELVRRILTPYYERRYKIVQSEDSLFKDM